MVKSHFKQKIGVFDIITILLMTLVGIVTLYPFLNVLFISFSSSVEVTKNGSLLLYPMGFNLESYQYVLQYAGLGDAFRNTIIITVLGTFINIVLTAAGAYVLTEKEMPGRNFLMWFVLVTMFFGGGLIPTYLVVSNLHLVNTLWALMLPGAVNTFNLILARNFFQGIPASLKEAARIDGASEFRILTTIILPLSMPIIATLILFYGVGHWNEFSSAIIYINSADLNPLQVLIRNMYNMAVDELNSDSLPPPVEGVRCATIMIATVPIVCVYPFLQKYFVKGVMVGSLKG
jgi:putative aldouronate transport system permease protein